MGFFEGTEKVLAVTFNSDFTPIWGSNNSNKRISDFAIYLYALLTGVGKFILVFLMTSTLLSARLFTVVKKRSPYALINTWNISLLS